MNYKGPEVSFTIKQMKLYKKKLCVFDFKIKAAGKNLKQLYPKRFSNSLQSGELKKLTLDIEKIKKIRFSLIKKRSKFFLETRKIRKFIKNLVV